MARAPLLQLSGISLTFGGNPVFSDLGLTVQPGDRLALIGRNGSGKSTLMKVMAGLVEPDAGSAAVPPGTSIGYMEQDPDLSAFATLGDFAASGLAETESWRVDAAAEGLKFRPEADAATASGGERRRAALARLLAQAPDLMLLDEPTNHLDVQAIGWLERQLADTRAAYVLISHDRAFLRALSRGMLWIDRGVVRRLDRGFSDFEDWREALWAEEDDARHKLERKIRAEAKWAVEGISARRKRNMGRVRALADLRAERAAMIRRQGTAEMALESGATSGRMVFEAKDLTKTYDGRAIVRGLDIKVMRGDRLALVGPNGVGKTTLLKLLTGEIAPDAGSVRHGTNLDIAVFDQARATLDLTVSLWDGMVNDPSMRVTGRSDQVMVRGQPRHVVAYLKDFLFDESQARAPVGSLSGGERARLLLARIMARQSNLLILDEPTNDLDVETLDLLQDLLGEYDGTVILVSHDRDFIDRVATTTLLMEDGARATLYAGGWSDMQAQRAAAGLPPAAADEAQLAALAARPAVRGAAPEPAPGGSDGGGGSGRPVRLSFTERHRLEALPGLIERLEAEIGKLGALLEDADLFTREPVKFRKATEAMSQRQCALDAAEAEWLLLAEKAEG